MIKTYRVIFRAHPLLGERWYIRANDAINGSCETQADAANRMRRQAASTVAAWQRNGYTEIDQAVADDGLSITLTATPPGNEYVAQTLRLPARMWQAVTERAQHDGVPAVEIVRRALGEYLARLLETPAGAANHENNT